MKLVIILSWFLLLGAGCAQTYTPAEYLEETSKESFSGTKTVGDLQFTTIYQPNAYRALKQYGLKITQSQLDSFVAVNDKIWHFEFRIQSLSGRPPLENEIYNQEKYSEKVHYLTEAAQNDIKLIVNLSDTIPCLLYHFERDYGTTPYHTMVLGFKKAHDFTQLAFHFTDRLFGTGPINIDLDEGVFLQPPHLKVKL